MIRVIITQIVLFCLPFLAYFVYRAATHGAAGQKLTPLGRVWFVLTIIGTIFVAAGFVYFALTGNESTGIYVPTQYRDGELIPGGFRPR